MGARYIFAVHHRHLAGLGWNHCIDRRDHGGVLSGAGPLVDVRRRHVLPGEPRAHGTQQCGVGGGHPRIGCVALSGGRSWARLPSARRSAVSIRFPRPHDARQVESALRTSAVVAVEAVGAKDG